MKTIIKYKASDGTEFDSSKLCVKHEKLINKVKAIMSRIAPIPKNIYDGWIQHKEEDVIAVKVSLLKLALPMFDGFPELVKAIKVKPETVHPMSIVGRILSDSMSPIYDGWHRLCCIDDKFREHNQPYFAINGPDKNHKCLNP